MDFIFDPTAFDRRRFSKAVTNYALPVVGVTVMLVAVASWWSKTHELVLNLSSSLPGNLYYASKGGSLSKGGQVAFNPDRTPIIRRHFGDRRIIFVKNVLGVPGDVVTRDSDRRVFINGQFVGRAKEKSHWGELLEAGPTGRIPRGCYYAGSQHRDGLDSRYAAVGFICERQIYGKAEVLL